MFESWVQNEIKIIDFPLALVGMLTSSSKLCFFKRSSFKLSYETVTRIVLCYSHQGCCLLYYLREINNGIHTYQLPLTFTLLFPDPGDLVT